MDTPAARLEKKFKRKHRLIESDIGKPEKAALQRLLKEGRVVRLRAYYLAGYEPTLQSESEYFIHRDHLAKCWTPVTRDRQNQLRPTETETTVRD
jgi:hypothetical protein